MAKKIAASGKAAKDMNLRELNDRYAQIWDGEMNDRSFKDTFRDLELGKDIDQEKRTEFEKWDDELRTIEAEIKVRKRDEEIENRNARSGPKIPGTDTESDEKYDPNFKPERRNIASVNRKAEKRGIERLSKEEKKVYNLVQREHDVFDKATRVALIYGKESINDILDEEERAIFKNQQTRDRWDFWKKEARAQSTTTTAGGYTIPQGFIPDIVTYLKYISVFFDEFNPVPTAQAQSLFSFYKTDAGNDVPMPTGDDTGNTGELLAENSDGSSSSADLTFGQITLKAYKYSTKMIKASTELLEDSGSTPSLPEYISEAFGSRIGRVINPHLTTGDNSSKPQGIVTGATSGKVTASTTAVTFPEILALIHSVDPSYRNRPTVRFMFHDNILLYLKQITVGASTTNARPLWAPGYNVGAPPTIDGFQYLINQGMASSVATGNKIMLFGDMKGYAVRLVNNFRMLTLKERYAEFDQTAWIGFCRADGRTLNTAAIKYLRVS